MLSALLLHSVYVSGYVYLCVWACLFVQSCKYWRQQKVCQQNCLPFPFHTLLCGEMKESETERGWQKLDKRPAVRRGTSDDWEKSRETQMKSQQRYKRWMERDGRSAELWERDKNKEGEGRWRWSERTFDGSLLYQLYEQQSSGWLKTNAGAIWGYSPFTSSKVEYSLAIY